MQTGQVASAAELRYLVEVSRQFASGSGPTPSPPADIDWDVFSQWLIDHRLVASLGPALSEIAAPIGFKHPLEALRRRLWAHNQLLIFELLRILPALERTGAEPIVLKGPALAYSVYPDPEMRFFADLDILVRKELLADASSALYERGYRQAELRRHESYYDQHHFHRILHSPTGIHVELHWDLSRPAGYSHYDLDGFRARSTSIDIEGLQARIPSGSDHILFTTYQQLVCGFTNFWRLLDTALLIRAGAAAERDLAARAKQQGLATALWLLLELTRELTGTAAPAGLESDLRPGPFAGNCLRSLGLAEKSLTLYARERSGLRDLVYWLCSPSAGDALSELRRYVVPGRERLLDLGYHPERLPGLPRRSFLSLRRGLSATKIIAYQGWRLAGHLLQARPLRQV